MAAIDNPLPHLGGSKTLDARRVLLFLGGYFLLQSLFRALISSSAELDESEQLMWTQVWAWGYGSDPPLYTWLQILTFRLLGTNILALAVMKNALLFSAFLFTYLAAREITGNPRTATLAALSLLLFPQITWESQRDLTHSVLATALASATFLVGVRMVKHGAPRDYLFLGLCLGLGTLSKYSYCLLAFALAAAGLSIPEIRRRLLNRWIWTTLLVLAAIVAWHVRWALLSPDLALRRSEEVIRDNAGTFFHSRAIGLFSIIKCLVMLFGVLVVAYGVSFRGRTGAPGSLASRMYLQWIGRTFLIIGAICLVVILGLGIDLRDRWFQPVVFLAAIAAAVWAGNRLDQTTEKRFAALVLGIGLAVLTILPGIPLAAAATHRPTRLNAPYSRLNRGLRNALPEPGVIAASTRLVGGNLRLGFQRSTVIVPEFHALPAPRTTSWLVVWDATKSAPPPAPLVKLVLESKGTNVAEMNPTYVLAPFQYTRAKSMKLAFVVLPPTTQ